MNAAGVGPSDTAAGAGVGVGVGAAPSAPVDLDEALVQCLRSQTRLNAVVKEVTYTDPATSSGSGVLYCLELKRDFPFSCKAITALKGEAAKLTTAHDRCTFKLSEKNNEIRATSIRLKNRVTSAPGSGAAATSASSGSSSIAFLQQRHEQGSLSIYDGDSPLNSLEYAPALSAPIHVMALQGPHFLSAPPYSVPQPPPPSLPLLQPSSLPLPTDTGASAALLPGGVGSTTTVTTIGTTGSFFDYPHHREDSPFSPPTAAAAATDVPASSSAKGYP